MYMLVAFLSSLCFTIAAVIRRFHSDHSFFTNTIITITFFICYCFYFVGKGILTSWDKEYMNFPWYVDNPAMPGTEIFSKRILILLIIGGTLEFMANHFLILGFNNAFMAGLNSGICMSLFVSNSILILLASYFLFKERVTVLQLIGIILIIVSVALVSMFSHRNLWF